VALGFEENLWAAAEELRGHVEPAEYKHIVLGLVFLRYATDPGLAARAGSGIAVPKDGSWASLRSRLGGRDSAAQLAAAVDAMERSNPEFAGVVSFDAARLGGARTRALVDAISAIPLDAAGSRDVLGRVYEYFLGHFASAEGRSGGEYYTPPSVVELLVRMVVPRSGTVYDPCCGTAGMFVQSERLRARGANRDGRHGGLRFFGQESSPRALRIARMNLALRGIDADLGGGPADSFREDRHPDLRADVVLANPPFNARAWGADALSGDPRWRFGVPPRNRANFAWIQHILARLATEGVGAFVLANGTLSSEQRGEGAIRQRIVDADLVECVVALPPQLFYGTQIPACIWIVSHCKSRGGAGAIAGKTLFVDARSRGRPLDRVHAELTGDDVAAIAGVYHRWRSKPAAFRGVAGFARVATVDEIRAHRYALVPGRYVGFAPGPERRAALDRSLLDLEMSEVRARVAAVDTASARFLAALEAMTRG